MLGQVLVPSVPKTHVLVVTVELIWFLFLNIFFFSFVPTANKSLWFTSCRKRYVSLTAVVLTNGRLLFIFMYAVHRFNIHRSFSTMIVYLRNMLLLSTLVVRMLLATMWVSGRKDVKQLSINISKLKVES